MEENGCEEKRRDVFSDKMKKNTANEVKDTAFRQNMT